MTKGELKTSLCAAVDQALSGLEDGDSLDQTNLTIATDAVAECLDTVNPNGPHYPSTPR